MIQQYDPHIASALAELYHQRRKLDQNPEHRHVEYLAQIPQFTQTFTSLESYISRLKEIDKEVAAQAEPVVRHAIVSHLFYLLELGQPELAYYLTKSEIDPLTQIVPNGHRHPRVAVAGWEDDHIARNQQYIDELLALILNPSTRGSLNFLTGPMFSAKTDGLLSLVQQLGDCRFTGACHAFIFAELKEEYITARRGGRGRSNLVESINRLKAEPVYLGDFVRYANTADVARGDLIVFDEAAFVAWSPEDLTLLRATLLNLVNRGVHIVLTGLDTDFRAINLPSADLFKEYAQTFACESFSLLPVATGLETVHATHTARTDKTGFIDLLLPVVIGRDLHIVDYFPVPVEAHIFASLQENDPDLYEHLLAIGGQKKLLDWYTAQQEG